MGGAADHQRSSSPLKRRASDLEEELSTIPKDDTEMGGPISPQSLDDNHQRCSALKEDIPESSIQNHLMNENGLEAPSSGTMDDQESSEESTLGIRKDALPPVDEQVYTVMKIVETHHKVSLQVGEIAYVISKKWLNQVQSRSSTAKAIEKTALEGEIGPIDNSDIVQEILEDGNGEKFVRLIPGLGRLHFEYFPEEAWQYVFKLYGLQDGQVPIIRKAINTNPDREGLPNIEYERDPPIFVIHRLWSANSPIPLPQLLKAQNPKAPIFVFSRNDLFVEILRRIKKVASIDMSTRVRLWKVPRNFSSVKSISASIANEVSPPASRSNTPSPESLPQPQDSWTHLLVDVETFLKLEKGSQRILDINPDDTVAPYKGTKTIQMASLDVDQALVVDERVETDYLSQYVGKVKNNVPISTTRGNVTYVKSASDSGRASPSPSGPMTRGRNHKSTKTVGTVGLQNLGNTCYMNSALQCVRSVEELTKYFLTNQAAEEINRDNPLGNHGLVADAYNDLLHQIYKDPPQGTIYPRQFKTTIGRIVPSFSGYGQQDSQEFLGFLLDGLQEDLSRIKKKPYIEKPDSTDEMVGNPEAIREMAAKVWDITKKRDDSVIADLFTGMYKSTLVCPVCDKVSITFDPFNNLTLQLPIENTWSHPVTFFPLHDRPMRIGVDMDKQASIKVLKEFISKRTSVPVERLFVAEEYKLNFYKFYEDMKPVSEAIQKDEHVTVYELEAAPTNWPPPKKPGKQKVHSSLNFGPNVESHDDGEVPHWDDPMSAQMLVPVIHRVPGHHKYRNPKAWMYALVPHFVVVTPLEARDEDSIRRKVLEKVATLTTFQGFHENEGEDESDDVNDSTDPDLVLTSASDADSAGDGKVVAASIDGDEELVDVKMKESQDVRESIEITNENGSNFASQDHRVSSLKRKLRTKRPKWINSDGYVDPQYQNIFSLKYFTGSKEIVPVGWGGAVDEEKEYQLLSSRAPQVVQDVSDEEEQLQNDGFSRRTPSETESSDAESLQLNPSPMKDDSSDEDEHPRYSTALPVRPITQGAGVRVGYNRRSNNGMKTYSNKGVKPTPRNPSLNGRVEESVDDGPLIRLGEGLVVDWVDGAFDCLFGGYQDNLMRGRPTFVNETILSFEDPELEIKRKARLQRKKNGITLDECLDEFGKEEILSEMDTWYCPRCKEHRRASKKFELWKTPDILVMHLKRFSSNAMRRDKVDVLVDFPVEGLNLTSRVIEKEDGKQEIYDLFAVDDHWGGLGGGHYTAFAKSFIDYEWYEYNDSSVSKQKDTSRIVSSGAYLLFYRRRSDVPLGGPRFKEISDIYNKSSSTSDDESETGEDQRLVGDSSPHGSSSALTGVGAAHQLVDGFLGGGQMTRSPAMPMSNMIQADVEPLKTINPADLDNPPAYTVNADDGVPLLPADQEMNDLEDEGVDMNMGYSNFLEPGQAANHPLSASWNFDSIASMQSKTMNPSGANSMDLNDDDIDGRSDIAAHNSSASEGSLAERYKDFANTEPEEGEWERPESIPDMSDEAVAAVWNLRDDIIAENQLTTVGVNEVPAEASGEDVEDEAAEIRVEEDEVLKMD